MQAQKNACMNAGRARAASLITCSKFTLALLTTSEEGQAEKNGEERAQPELETGETGRQQFHGTGGTKTQEETEALGAPQLLESVKGAVAITRAQLPRGS